MNKKNILNEPEVVYAARTGISRQKVNEVINLTGFSLNEMGKFTHVTPRTLQRKNLNEKLPSNISEKVLLIQNLYIRGSNVLGSLEAFKTWMSIPNVSFGGSIPKDFLDTFTGVEYLMNELGRIEHGLVA
jgi:putative toxin-antitoxin system antitoxin component (TIGR02293 family)